MGLCPTTLQQESSQYCHRRTQARPWHCNHSLPDPQPDGEGTLTGIIQEWQEYSVCVIAEAAPSHHRAATVFDALIIDNPRVTIVRLEERRMFPLRFSHASLVRRH